MNASMLNAEFLSNAAPIVDSYGNDLKNLERGIEATKNERLSLSDYDKAFLATMYDNVDKVLDKYRRLRRIKDDRTYSENVGPFRKHAFNIISALYTTFDLRDMISWQPMTQKIGAIYRMTYEYDSDKGNISKGDTMFSSTTAGKRSRYYSSDTVYQEPLTFTFSTDSTASLAYYPLIDPTALSIVVDGATGGNGTYTYLGTSGSNWTLQLDGGGSSVGTLNPTTGVITLTGVDASDADTATVTYRWNSEKFSDSVPIPRVTARVSEKLIQAERRNLLIDAILDVSFDFEQNFGQDFNAELEASTVQFLQNEMAFRILGEMYDGANGNGGDTYTFYRTPLEGVTKEDNAQELYDLLAQMSQKLRGNIGRGQANKLVVGDDLLAYMKILPTERFTRASVPSGDGPYYAGNLNGDYDVYYNPDLAADAFFVTYKGQFWWEAPYYVGTYMPVMGSEFMMFPDFHQEKGYLALDAFEYEVPTSVVVGSVKPGRNPIDTGGGTSG